MTTPTNESYESWIGRTAYDSNGSKLGDITNLYYDDVSGRPEWLTISTGWFGTKEQFVPITGSSTHEDGVRVAHAEQHIKDAPSIDVDDDHLEADEERRLYSHYDLDHGSTDPLTAFGDGPRADRGFTVRDLGDRPERGTHDDDSRERRIRLRKYVISTPSN